MDSSLIKYAEKNLKNQNFSLPKSIIKFIIQNASGAFVLQKLYQTYKYFYLKNPYFIVDNLILKRGQQRFELEIFDDCFDFTHMSDEELSGIFKNKNIWITQKFHCDSLKETLRNIILPKIIHFHVYELSLHNVELLIKEFKILMKNASKNLKIVDLFYTFIYLHENSKDDSKIPDKSYSGYSDKKIWEKTIGAKVPLEDLLALIPQIESFSIHKTWVTNQTMKKLLSIKFENKFKKFVLEKIKGALDVHLFYKFLKKNMASEAEINITFRYKKMKKFVDYFKNAFNDKIEKEDGNIKNWRTKKLESCRDYGWKSWYKSAKNLPENELNFNMIESLKANFGYLKLQNFSFRNSLINYLINSKTNAKTMRKLQQSCKYFYSKIPFFIIDEIELNNGVEEWYKIGQNRHSALPIGRVKMFEKKILVINKIHYYKYLNIKPLASRIYQCEAKEIYLNLDYSISPEDMKFLGESKKIEKFLLRISDKYKIKIEEIMLHLVNAKEIFLEPCHITMQTLNKMISFPWNKNLKQLELLQIDQPIDVDLFHEFLEKALAPKAFVDLFFYCEPDNDDLYPKIFEPALKAKIKTWKPKREIPSIKVQKFINLDEFFNVV